MNRLGLSKSGQVLACKKDSDIVHLYKQADSIFLFTQEISFSQNVVTLKFSLDDQHLFIGLHGGGLIIFMDNGQEYALFQTINDASDQLSSIAMSKDCKLLISGSYDFKIRIYFYYNGQFVLNQTITATYRIRKVALSQNQLV